MGDTLKRNDVAAWVIRAAQNMRDAMNAKREVRRCDPEPETRREVNRVYRECERDLFAACALWEIRGYDAGRGREGE